MPRYVWLFVVMTAKTSLQGAKILSTSLCSPLLYFVNCQFPQPSLQILYVYRLTNAENLNSPLHYLCSTALGPNVGNSCKFGYHISTANT